MRRGFDLKWIVEDFQVALTAELDFTNEARNSNRCRHMFAHRRDVKVPKVYGELSSKRVLTMEYIDGVRASDLDGLARLCARPPLYPPAPARTINPAGHG